MAFKPDRSFFLKAAILIFLGAAGGVFLLRSPVLVVTDPSFNGVYGAMRTRIGGIERFFALRRRVVPVLISESAAPDVAALAIEAASPSPHAVLVPYRYYESGHRYKENFPQVPVFVFDSGGERLPAESGLVPVRTDRETDFYRAGLCAAFLAREGENGDILVFSEGTMPNGEREAFLEGLRVQGFLRNPVYLGLNSDYQNYQGVSCVVLNGSAPRFLSENRGIPVLLFSWIDPALTPPEVKVIFDDSPWTLAAEAVKTLEQGAGEKTLPSRPLVPQGRGGKGTRRTLNGLVREERPR
jgi:hypothetical protein